jgi:putative restriction endonuclease
MPIRLVVALTDPEWFEHLRAKPDLLEVNFWAPSGRSFRALTAGEVFLFRLHAPYRVIVGGGVSCMRIHCPALWRGRHSEKQMVQPP